MAQNEIVDVLNDVLKSKGFKKKGNWWVNNGEEINKLVNLQKSAFSNRFYINYGVNLNGLPLNGLSMHVFYGLGSTDLSINKRMQELLNLDNLTLSQVRKSELRGIIEKYILKFLSNIDNKLALAEALSRNVNSPTVSFEVKKYLGII